MFKGVIVWFVSNGVVVNLFMIVIVVFGLMVILMNVMEVFLEIFIEIIIIMVLYFGVVFEEVESGVCVCVEEVI